jgi:cobalamin synthase
VTIDLRRLRPAELLALGAGALLAVSLFLPWFELAGVREDAWNVAAAAAVPSALAALAALALVALTALQRSPALPLACAVAAMLLALLATALVAAYTASPPAGASGRCYGVWLALAACVAVLAAALWSLRDERPFRGVAVSG